LKILLKVTPFIWKILFYIFGKAYAGVTGMESYCDRYSQTLYDVSLTLGPVPKFEGPLVKEINEQLCAKVPIEKLPERRVWRDACLTKLSTLKKEMNN
jgi:L-gulonate 3-dehydrogenase